MDFQTGSATIRVMHSLAASQTLLRIHKGNAALTHDAGFQPLNDGSRTTLKPDPHHVGETGSAQCFDETSKPGLLTKSGVHQQSRYQA